MRPRFKLLTKRIRKDEDGATAIEFGLIAAPFFAVIFATIDFGIAFLIGDVIEDNLRLGARELRTGQAQQASVSETQFKQQICGSLQSIFDCQNSLEISVSSSPDLATAVSNGISSGVFNIGPQEDWHYVEVLITRNYFTPFLNLLVSPEGPTLSTEYQLLRTRLIRAEPFGTPTTPAGPGGVPTTTGTT